MAKITILGGHGKVALLAAPVLVQAGHQVTSVIRNPDHEAEVAQTGATPKVADLENLDTAGLTELLTGQDAVVWSAGAGGGNPDRTYAVDRDAAQRSMDAADAAGAKRYVMVSYFGSDPNHGVDPNEGFFAYAEAKSAADTYLRDSSLDWTVLGPSGLTLDEPTGKIDVSSHGDKVSRANVAQVIAASIADDVSIGKTINFNDGDTPIAEAVKA